MEQAQHLYRSALAIEEGEGGCKKEGVPPAGVWQNDATDEPDNVAVLDVEAVELTAGDGFRATGAFVLPWLMGVVPMLLPFGNPFHKFGDNSVVTNSAFHFWYVPLGWGLLWNKLILWSCELWGSTFYIPFMTSKAGSFSCNASLLALLISCGGSVLFFLAGHLIFHNPVPLGTVSVGIPTLVVCLLSIYALVVPPDLRSNWRDHVRIVRCWIPIVLWVIHIVVASLIVRVQWLALKEVAHKPIHMAGSVAMQLLFALLREAFTSLPPEWFMGDQNQGMSLLWNVDYAIVCTGLSGWLFVGVPADMMGILTVIFMISVTVMVSFIQLYRAKSANAVCVVFLSAGCDVVAAVAWLMIFLWAAFGPNSDYIYIMRDLDDTAKVHAAVMVTMSILASFAKCLVMAKLSPVFLDPHVVLQTKAFFLKVMRQWYWLSISMLANDCVSCGACMLMMHGGMDFSFQFDDWMEPSGTAT